MTILRRSALNNRIKRSTAIQEGVRRLRNCSESVDWKERSNILTEWSATLRRSGYSAMYRREVVRAAVSIHEKILEDDNNEVRPMYRERKWQREEREREKEMRKENWYRARNPASGNGTTEKYEAPLIIDPTINGDLKAEMDKICETFNTSHGMNVKVYERGGRRVSSLVKRDPVGSEHCGRKECICLVGGKLCGPLSVGYRYVCLGCEQVGQKAVYFGETSQGIYIRKRKHAADIKQKNGQNALYKHNVIHHQGVDHGWNIEVTGTFQKPMLRQINEGVRIAQAEADTIILNSRSEFHQAPLVRVVPTRGIHLTQEQQHQRRGGGNQLREMTD